jgi:hypothetical protein
MLVFAVECCDMSEPVYLPFGPSRFSAMVPAPGNVAGQSAVFAVGYLADLASGNLIGLPDGIMAVVNHT